MKHHLLSISVILSFYCFTTRTTSFCIDEEQACVDVRVRTPRATDCALYPSAFCFTTQGEILGEVYTESHCFITMNHCVTSRNQCTSDQIKVGPCTVESEISFINND